MSTKTLLAISLAAMFAMFAGASASARPTLDDELPIIWPDCVNGKCNYNQHCDGGKCKPGCVSDTNCAPSMYCINGTCGA